MHKQVRDGEEEEESTVLLWTKRERAGGSVNATLRPLWYCEAATAVAQDETETKASDTSKNENQDQNRRTKTKNNYHPPYNNPGGKKINFEIF